MVVSHVHLSRGCWIHRDDHGFSFLASRLSSFGGIYGRLLAGGVETVVVEKSTNPSRLLINCALYIHIHLQLKRLLVSLSVKSQKSNQAQKHWHLREHYSISSSRVIVVVSRKRHT